MTTNYREIDFKTEDLGWKGSKLRCLLLTSMGKDILQKQLISLINQRNPGKIDVQFPADFVYYPQGLLNPTEIELDKAKIPVEGSIDYCQVLNSWWLADSARTPVWDFVCTAIIDGTPGFILIEAKAHRNETKKPDASGAKKGSPNRTQIETALAEINSQYGFELAADDCFQLSNRFAWSLKLASEGIPVILIYLGCLNTREMTISRNDALFTTAQEWEQYIRKYSQQVNIHSWENAIQTQDRTGSRESKDGKKVYPLIRSLDIQIEHVSYDMDCRFDR